MIILSNDYIENVPNRKKSARGGPALFLEHFSRCAEKKGHTWIHVIVRKTKGGVSRTYQQEKNMKYHFVTFPLSLYTKVLRAKPNDPVRQCLAPVVKHIRSIIKRVNPDIVYINGFALYNWVILQAAHEERVPIVMQHAGLWNKELAIYRDHFSPTGYRNMCAMEKDITYYRAHEIFLSPLSLRLYRKDVARVPSNRAHIIPLPYYVHWARAIAKKNRSRKNCNFLVGMVARWDRIKNHAGFLELAREIKKQRKPWICHAVTKVARTGKFKEFKREYHNRIAVLKPMPQRKLFSFYKKMDLLVLPSHFDVSPNIVLEAARLGTPTVISPHVGWADLYRTCGAREWVVGFTHASHAARRIEKVIGRPFPQKLVNAFRVRHNPNKVFGQYLSLFESMT